MSTLRSLGILFICSSSFSHFSAHFIVDFHESDGENGEPLSELERHQIKHRELFYSRHTETLPATHIRGE